MFKNKTTILDLITTDNYHFELNLKDFDIDNIFLKDSQEEIILHNLTETLFTLKDWKDINVEDEKTYNLVDELATIQYRSKINTFILQHVREFQIETTNMGTYMRIYFDTSDYTD